MTTNSCPVCAGIGRVLAFGVGLDPVPVPCPECAGLAITPASADEASIRTYTAREITVMLLRRPALPAPVEPVQEAPAG